jgi:hypothetical protein
LKEKTGIVYELHIIAEAGANGSILSLESDMTLHDRCDADTHELHLPMAYVTDFFQISLHAQFQSWIHDEPPWRLQWQDGEFRKFFYY